MLRDSKGKAKRISSHKNNYLLLYLVGKNVFIWWNSWKYMPPPKLCLKFTSLYKARLCCRWPSRKAGKLSCRCPSLRSHAVKCIATIISYQCCFTTSHNTDWIVYINTFSVLSCSLSPHAESTASTWVSFLWRLWLPSMLRVPWKQDVSVSKLLYRCFQSPEVYSLQWEWSSAL